MNPAPRPLLAVAITLVAAALALIALAVVLVATSTDAPADAAQDARVPAASHPASDSPPASAPPTAVPSPIATPRSGIAELPDPVWLDATAASAGIPRRALAAYAGAAIELSRERPGCGLGWNTLAAIGYVESAHGTLQGGHIGDDGRARPRIVGVALDGTGTAAVADTDGGVLDGDDVWDHALGPMQFIPSTWREHGADGDGDGGRNVHDIDDAALAAAEYLCFEGTDLSVAGNWIAAVSSYNPSADYNARVAAAADAYARAALPAG